MTVTYQFGDWTVEPEANQLRRDGQSVRLQRKEMEVLCYLLERSGEVVSSDELLENVWSDRVVEPNVVHRVVSRLRRALDEDASEKKYVETISKRGYRTIAAVALVSEPRVPEDLQSHEPATVPSTQIKYSVRGLITGLGILAVIAVLWGSKAELQEITEVTEPDGTVPAMSIAVLPLANLSATDQQDYLIDGLVAELTQSLANVPSLRVASITASSYFKDRQTKLALIGEELKVRYVVEGSIRVAGERLRLSVHLTDVSAGLQLWSKAYDRELTDLVRLQVELSRAIVTELPLLREDAQFAAAIQAGTTNPAAYDAYLRGLKVSRQVQFPGDLEQAQTLARSAVELDPQFYEAYALLAEVGVQRSKYPGGEPPADMIAESIRLLEAIEQMDVQQQRPNRADHLILLHALKKDWASHELAVRRQLMKPAPEANRYYEFGQVLREAGLPQLALAYLEAAESMEPRNANFKLGLAELYFHIGEYHRTIVKADECLSLVPSSGLCISYKGGALARLGDVDQALAISEAGYWMSSSSRCILLLAGGKPCDAAGHYDAVVTANIGLAVLDEDYDEAFRWIDHAIKTENLVMHQFRAQTHSWPQAFHADPRWNRTLERIGRTNQWRDTVCRRALSLTPFTGIGVDCEAAL